MTTEEQILVLFRQADPMQRLALVFIAFVLLLGQRLADLGGTCER